MEIVIPDVDEVFFFLLDVIAMSSFRSQYCLSAICSATASLPSSLLPLNISTNPPKTERAAEPEPLLANSDNFRLSRSNPAALVAANASAANAEADEARPAAVGKLLSLLTFAAIDIPAMLLIISRKSLTRFFSFPLIFSLFKVN